MIQAVLLLVFAIAGLCFFIGLLIATVTVIWTKDMALAVQMISNGYYLLVGLVPVALWLGIFVSMDQSEYAVGYNTRIRALATTLQGALVGSLFGGGPVFLATAIYMPVIMSHYPIEQFSPAVLDAIVWSHLLLVTAAAVVSAFPLGLWAFFTVSGREA